MKQIIAGIIALSISFSASAQGKNKEHKQPGEFKKERPEAKHFNHEHFGKKSGFSNDQKTQIKSLNEKFRNDMKDVKKNENITVKEQKERREALIKEHKEALKTILTPEQKAKLEEKQKTWAKDKEGDKLNAKLKLNDNQGQRIKEVNEQFRDKMKEIQNDNTLSEQEKKEQRSALQKQHSEGIKLILTQEQKDKLEALKKNRPNRETGK